MIINRFNIEKWMFDYFEGNLSLHESIAFEQFLEQNPQFDSEFEMWQDSYQINEVEVPVFNGVKSLEKSSFLYSRVLVFGFSIFIFATLLSTLYYFNLDNGGVESTGVSIIESMLSIDNGVAKNKYKVLKVDVPNSIHDVEEFNLTNNTSKNDNNLVFKSGKKSMALLAVSKTFSDVVVDTISKNENRSSKSIRNEVVLPRFDVLNLNNNVLDSNIDFSKMARFKKREMMNVYNKEKFYNALTNSTDQNKYKYLHFDRKREILKDRNELEERQKNNSNYKINKEKRKFGYYDNFALIAAFIEDKFGRKKKTGKHNRFLSRFKNKEIALTNTHDPIFMKTNSNPLENNIALAGGLDLPRIKASYSNRWLNSKNNKVSGSISGDIYLRKINAGLGVTLSQKNMTKSNLKVNDFGVTYVQRLALKDNSTISFAINYEHGVLSNMETNTDLNAPIEWHRGQHITINNFSSKSIGKISSSIWYDGKFFYGGTNFSNVKMINYKNNSANEFVEYINPFKFAMQLGTDYRRSVYSALVLSPQVNYSYSAGVSDLWLGNMLKYKRFLVGLGASFNNAYKANFGVQGNSLRLIYGFNYSKSSLEKRLFSIHEISLRYLIRSKNSWKK